MYGKLVVSIIAKCTFSSDITISIIAVAQFVDRDPFRRRGMCKRTATHVNSYMRYPVAECVEVDKISCFQLTFGNAGALFELSFRLSCKCHAHLLEHVFGK